MTYSSFRFLALCLTGWLTAVTFTHGQAVTAEYDRAINLAVDEYGRGNFAEARSQFQKAHALYPNARTWRGVGLTEFELRNYGECIHDLEQALAATVKPLHGDMRTDTEALLARARGYVARINLALDPGAASVVVDGIPMRVTADHPLVLEVGDHVLEFRADGRISERRQLSIKGGEDETIRVRLTEVTAKTENPEVKGVTGVKEVPKNAVPVRDDRKLAKNPWLWTAVGVAAVAIATGLALGLRDNSKTENAEPYPGSSGVTLSAFGK